MKISARFAPDTPTRCGRGVPRTNSSLPHHHERRDMALKAAPSSGTASRGRMSRKNGMRYAASLSASGTSSVPGTTIFVNMKGKSSRVRVLSKRKRGSMTAGASARKRS